MLAKCVLSILELHWNQQFRDKRTKLKICCQVLTLSKQWQNRSFHIIKMMKTAMKFMKMKNACAKRAKPLFSLLKMQICDVLIGVVVLVA